MFTDHTRSMGEGYVFTRVCHSVNNWGVSFLSTFLGGGGVWSEGVVVWSGGVSGLGGGGVRTPGMATAAVGTHPTGMLS